MRFDVYGHYELVIVREGNEWKIFKLGAGTRVLLNDVVIPADMQQHEIAPYLDDLFHELAKPGQTIRRVG